MNTRSLLYTFLIIACGLFAAGCGDSGDEAADTAEDTAVVGDAAPAPVPFFQTPHPTNTAKNPS